MESEAGWYITTYPAHCRIPRLGTGAYGSNNLYASSLRDAYRIIAARGVGEIIDFGPVKKPMGHPNIPKMITRRVAWLKVLHASCYMGWHAMRAEVVTPDELLGDGGLIHEIIHAMCGITDAESAQDRRLRLADLAFDIETRIPGWRESEEEK